MGIALQHSLNGLLSHESIMHNCLLFPMVGLKSEIFAFIADNFAVEVLLQNLWTTLYIYRQCH